MINIDKKYIGIPFDEMNCWQFICYFYKNELGIKLPSYENEYSNAGDIKAITKLYKREIAIKLWPETKEPVFPNIIVFKINGWIWHAGIYLNNKKMLHTQKVFGSLIESYKSMRWKNRIFGFYRYAG